MEQQKLENNKETLAFLQSKYPKCFFLEGKVKPLKIGIFQDLAKDLASTEVVSNRLLRTCLRHYTSSWRYLASIKPGVARVDLQGDEGEKVEKQHADHAQEKLKESKQKAAKIREAKASEANASADKGKSDSVDGKPAENKKDSYKKNNSKKFAQKLSSSPKKSGSGNGHSKRPTAAPRDKYTANQQIDDEQLAVGNKALVKLGKEPMPVEITDIAKDGISVQLNSGMTVKVQQKQLYKLEKSSK